VIVDPVDGTHVYVSASQGGNADQHGAVVIFDRAANGSLTQKPGTAGCINTSGNDDSGGGTSCATGRAVHDANALAASPDGKMVYLGSQGESDEIGGPGRSGSLALFSRAGNGVLTQPSGTAGCFSSDGADGYSGSGSFGACAVARGLDEPSGVAVSPDKLHLYVTASDYPSSIDVFARDQGTGALTQLAGTGGCTSEDTNDGTGLTCGLGRALQGATPVAAVTGSTNPSCVHVYVGGADSHSLTIFSRQPECPLPGAKALPDNKFTFTAKPDKRGRLKITATVPGPGSLDAVEAAKKSQISRLAVAKKKKGKSIVVGRAHATATKAGVVKFTVKPGRKARRTLGEKPHKLRVTVSVTYTPTGGQANTKTAKATLRKTHK
jgi:hypothetical protein